MVDLQDTDKPVVCIFSGGLDSTVLIYALVKKYKSENVKAIGFNYGQRHSAELSKAVKTAKKLGVDYKIIDISFVSDIVKDVCSLSAVSTVRLPTDSESSADVQANFVVPFRNLIFQSIALSYAESLRSEIVYLGIQNGDNHGFWDCRHEYYTELNKLTALNDKYKIRVLTPLIDFSKADEIKLGRELGVDFRDTWTCYNGGEKPCGICHSCAERLRAFQSLGLKDPLTED